MHLDKHTRLISLNTIPTLWTRGVALGYAGFEYSKIDTGGNVEAVVAPVLNGDNQQEFETMDGYVFGPWDVQDDWKYSMAWFFYHNKNTELLQRFGSIGRNKLVLRSVYILIEGNSEGKWGKEAKAKFKIGNWNLSYDGSDQPVNSIATEIKKLLNSNPCLKATGYNNNITIDFGARDKELLLEFKTTGEGQIATDPPSFGFTNCRYWADGKYLSTVFIGATEELENDDLPTLDGSGPDLLFVMRPQTNLVEEWGDDGLAWNYEGFFTFYVLGLRQLLTNSVNKNDVMYSKYLEYDIINAQQYDFEDQRPNGPQVPDRVSWKTLLNETVRYDSETEIVVDNAWGLSFNYIEGGRGFFWKYASGTGTHKFWTLQNFSIKLNGQAVVLETESPSPSVTITLVRTENVNHQVISSIYNRNGASWESWPEGPTLTIPADSSDSIENYSEYFLSSIGLPPFPDLMTEVDGTQFNEYLNYRNKIENADADADYYGTSWTTSHEDVNDGWHTSYPTFKTALNYEGNVLFETSPHRYPTSVIPWLDPPLADDRCLEHGNMPDSVYYGALLERDYQREFKTVQKKEVRSNVAFASVQPGFPSPPVLTTVCSIIDTTRPGSLCYVNVSRWKSRAKILVDGILGILETLQGEVSSKLTPLLNENKSGLDMEAWQARIDEGYYCFETPKQKASIVEWEKINTDNDTFNTTITDLALSHDELLGDDDAESARKEILDNIKSTTIDYLNSHSKVLFNNFASRELINIPTLELGDVYFIIPEF